MTVAIVPARGGSKEIPRKNMRLLDGMPLVGHVLSTLAVLYRDGDISQIVVSTDDDDIAEWCLHAGYDVVGQPGEDLGVPAVVNHVRGLLDPSGDVLMVQPTCPLVSPDTARKLLHEHRQQGARHTVLTSPVPHLLIDTDTGRHIGERVNRQQLGSVVREVGVRVYAEGVDAETAPDAGVACPDAEAVDIDDFDDLAAARRRLNSRRITFVVTAGDATGSGHLWRCLALADELAHHEVAFAFHGEQSTWALDLLKRRGHQIGHVEAGVASDAVVFDCLDTTTHMVAGVKAHGGLAVCLEDFGTGSDLADLVVNELYDDRRPNALTGARWSVLRPEFCGLPQRTHDGERVLVTFGGTDPAGLTVRVARACVTASAEVRAVVGPGAETDGWAPGVTFVEDANMMDEMRRAAVVVTSAGRTVHEAAALGTPVVSIAVNGRESRHVHVPGVVRLGLHVQVPDPLIASTVRGLLDAPDLRADLGRMGRAAVDGLGARRIAHRIEALLEGL